MEHNIEATQTPPHACRGFEDLMAWQLARRLMIECHKMADTLPAHERYDLVTDSPLIQERDGQYR